MTDANLMAIWNDSDAYERFMGRWSRVAGSIYLDWLALPKGLKWRDVGCGTGAFTEVLQQRSAAAEIVAIDPVAARQSLSCAPTGRKKRMRSRSRSLPKK